MCSQTMRNGRIDWIGTGRAGVLRVCWEYHRFCCSSVVRVATEADGDCLDGVCNLLKKGALKNALDS